MTPWTHAHETELRALLRLAYRRHSADRIDAGCTGKPKYPNRSAAERAMPRRDASYGAHPYRCRHCGEWHIGSIAKALKRPMKTIKMDE